MKCKVQKNSVNKKFKKLNKNQSDGWVSTDEFKDHNRWWSEQKKPGSMFHLLDAVLAGWAIGKRRTQLMPVDIITFKSICGLFGPLTTLFSLTLFAKVQLLLFCDNKPLWDGSDHFRVYSFSAKTVFWCKFKKIIFSPTKMYLKKSRLKEAKTWSISGTWFREPLDLLNLWHSAGANWARPM